MGQSPTVSEVTRVQVEKNNARDRHKRIGVRKNWKTYRHRIEMNEIYAVKGK